MQRQVGRLQILPQPFLPVPILFLQRQQQLHLDGIFLLHHIYADLDRGYALLAQKIVHLLFQLSLHRLKPGPLDLLLHLIEKNKVDIYDIPIVLITEQYLDYVSKMDTKDMDVMSEFLVMAATLVRIKSKMLLPVEEEEEEEFEDPRQELVERILEYKMYKYASYELKDRQVDAGRMVFKEPSIPEEIQDFKEDVAIEDLLSDVTLAKLQGIFNSVMKKQVDKIDPIRSKFGEIEKEEISLEDHIVFLDSYAKEHKTFSFRKLLENGSGKTYVIVTFLGILEMMKMGKLTIVQENIFDDILITYREKEDKRKEREE